MMVAKGYLTALLLAALFPGLALASTAMDDAMLFSEHGYRIDRYRSPTPSTAPGAATVGTQEVVTLLNATPPALPVDVINLTFQHGRFLQTETHHSLPGALWLPNTGLGHLGDDWYYSQHDWVGYLIDEVTAAIAGNMDHPIVVVCRSDCWLSWNAVKRLSEAGFQQLYWYRNGIDSWEAAGYHLEVATPRTPPFATHLQSP